MRYTDYISLFSIFIRKHFAFLINSYNFNLIDDKYDNNGSSCIVSYKNEKRFVQLVWGFHDAQFYFSVHKVLKNNEHYPYNDKGEGFFYIFELAYLFEPDKNWILDLDIEATSPTKEILENKIQLNSNILKKYGDGILKGEQWFDKNYS